MKYKNAGRYDLLLHDDIETILKRELYHLKTLQNELRAAKGGNLYIKQLKNRIAFTEYHNGKECGIGKDMKRVHRLARQKYISILTKNMESSYKELQKIAMKVKSFGEKYNTDSILRAFEAVNFDIPRILFSQEQLKWLNEPYQKNNFHPEDLKHITNGGVAMRSKSERIIGNKLEEWNIPYRYDALLVLGETTYYPDFTILKNNGEIIFWEHLGMMDKEDYFVKNCNRLREYRRHGLCEHTNLIVTWEEDLRDIRLLDQIIKSRICC